MGASLAEPRGRMLSKESASVRPGQSEAHVPEPVAPSWHTGALITLMVAVATTGWVLERSGVGARMPAETGRIAGVYLPMLLVQWGLFLYVTRVGRGRHALRTLLGPRWGRPEGIVGDLSWALVLGLLVEASELALGHWGMARSEELRTFLPRSALERLVWPLVALSAGTCEEVVYRGYLQTQLLAFTRRPWLAIGLQAVLFGLAHGEQGLPTVARFGLYGVALGALARRRGSLLPGMVGHVAIDLLGGFL